MRKIPIEFVRAGDILAKSLYNDVGGMLLTEGFILDYNIIDKLKEYGYLSISIKNKYSEEDIEEIIKPEVMNRIHNVYKNLSKMVEEYSKNNITTESKKVKSYVEELSNIVDKILHDILSSKNILENLASISIYDDYTLLHSLNMMMLSTFLAKGAGFNMDEIRKLAIGCVFHDIGKTFLPTEIVNKPGKLTEEEFNLVKQHPQKGHDFLAKYTELSITSRNIALNHHERIDGCGYPNGLKGDEIHKFSKIAAIGDVFDALVSDRPYRRGVPIHEAREYVLGGSSHFDIAYIELFAKLINPYPRGTMVYLSDGKEGIVHEVLSELYTRPKIMIYCENGHKVAPYVLELIKFNNIVIEKVIHIFSFEK